MKQQTQFKNESDIYSFWEKKNYFSADPASSKKTFSLLVPPPNLTGELHLGHAMQHSILDAIARFKRLQGFDVLLLPGVDHAGIQFEATFEKNLAKDDLSKRKLGREEWLKKAWEFKEEVYKSVSGSWRMMGLSADWKREVFTLDDGPREAVFETFKTFYDKGLIYKGPYIVQWCPKDRTAIEDAEVEYEERKEKLYYIKYRVANSNNEEFIAVATTRPETIFADVAVAVNPKDKRYQKYSGGQDVVYRPVFLRPTKSPVNHPLKIIRDERVEIDFGSGALKITPAHDFLDYEIGKDNKLLPFSISVIGKDGKLSDIAGKYSGMKVQEAREQIVNDLRDSGDLLDEKDYVHNVAVCERCKSVVEPIISEEWFVKVGDLAKEAVKTIKANEINFLPKNYAKILTDWLENIHDWCISRSLWWGHRIPVWYLGDEIQVSLESPGEGWIQDEQVLDTWLSSGVWPMSTLGWPDVELSVDSSQLTVNKDKTATDREPSTDNQLLGKYFPWDFEISAPEIKFLWIARMIMLSRHFTGQIPFKTMFFHGMLRDLEGRKFSKSLGNGIAPTYLIDKWGVDATRMALYTYSVPGRDGKVSKQILDERGKNYRNFGTKIRNVTRFILELTPDVIANPPPVILSEAKESPQEKIATSSQDSTRNDRERVINTDDEKIMADLDTLTKQVTKHLENIELHLACEALYEFTWHKFADVYLEKSKARRAEAQPVLEYVLKQLLILLHPFMPFVTEEIYQKFDVKKESIMLENWPASNAASPKKDARPV